MTETSRDAEQVFDCIIVGAGSAGCLLANRLSANPSHRVLLLEAGGVDNWHWIHIPVGYLYCIGNPRTDWCYRTRADPGLNERSLGYPRGKVLGASSQGLGRQFIHQRHDLHARPKRRLRRLGRHGQHGLVVGRGSAFIQALRRPSRRDQRIPRFGR